MGLQRRHPKSAVIFFKSNSTPYCKYWFNYANWGCLKKCDELGFSVDLWNFFFLVFCFLLLFYTKSDLCGETNKHKLHKPQGYTEHTKTSLLYQISYNKNLHSIIGNDSPYFIRGGCTDWYRTDICKMMKLDSWGLKKIMT